MSLILKRLITFLNCSLLSCGLLIVAAANATYFEKVLIDNNLPNVGTYSITQDNHGYLWLASTNTGLMQFDGYQFQPHPLLNTTLTKLKSVPDIDAIAFDRQNNLWAGSWGYGLAKIHAENGEIALFDGEADLLASPFVQKLFTDQQQRVWVGTTKGINRYDETSGFSRIDQQTDILPSRRIWDFAQTPDSTIWIATSGGLISWQDGKGFGQPLYPHGDSNADNVIRALQVIGDELWLGTRRGLFVYQPALQRFQRVRLPDEQPLPVINALGTSVEGNLLIGTFNGIYSVDPVKRVFVRRFQQNYVELEHINVRTFFIDKSQVTWVGTRESGLFFKTRQRSAFQNTADEALASLQNSITAPLLSLLAEPEQLWFGQQGSVSRYSHHSRQLQQFDIPGRVNVIRRAPDNVIWVGTDNGIFQYDTTAGKFRRFATPYTALNLPQQNARDIRFTDDNKTVINLWNNGVLLFDNQTQGVNHFLADISQTMVGDAIQATLVTPDHIWLASRLSGLYLLDRQTLSIVPMAIINSSLLLSPDFTGQLTCLAHAPQNSVVVCSEQGLLRVYLDSGAVELIDTDTGLAGKSLVGAHTDKLNNIWVMSTAGLDVIKPDGNIAHFNQVDGLNSNEMMFNAVAEDDRQLYFGSDAGIELVVPDRLLEPLPSIAQAITKVTFDQKPATASGRLTPLKSITVPADVSRVEFHFASFDFNNPARNRYLYKLSGYDDNWQQLNNGNIASFTNLAPGSYTLLMQASNNQQLFSGQISELAIVVQPHWWQRTSVHLMLAVAIIALISYIVKSHINKVHQVNILLEEAVAARTNELEQSLKKQQDAYHELQHLDLMKNQFISTVSHELRTPLTSISGALNLVLSGALRADEQKTQQLLQIANSNSQRLTLLINDLLDLEKLAANQMVFTMQRHDIEEIVQRAVSENSPYGHKRQVSLRYDPAPDDLVTTAMVDENRLLQVLANILSNAIKFSPEQREVIIRVQQQASNIVIAISDSGPGIAREFQQRIFQRFAQENAGNTREHGGTGLGLALSQELMHAMNGDISFVSEPGKGTTFYLTLPLQP
ncbi:ATP-binding protein [Arsukibacterium sp.]|uniref:ATP-binding protein n=1 Tax=Arsukibacterium sp. TaxID=1977258 RepID=UPI00356B43F9